MLGEGLRVGVVVLARGWEGGLGLLLLAEEGTAWLVLCLVGRLFSPFLSVRGLGLRALAGLAGNGGTDNSADHLVYDLLLGGRMCMLLLSMPLLRCLIFLLVLRLILGGAVRGGLCIWTPSRCFALILRLGTFRVMLKNTLGSMRAVMSGDPWGSRGMFVGGP